MIGNKIANEITRVSKNPQQNNSETVTIENYKEICKERYVSPEDRQQIIDKLRLKSQWEIWDILQGVSSLGV